MNKQFKILVAGILASSGVNAVAVKDKEPAAVHHYGGFCDYECMGEKVTSTLSHMKGDVEAEYDQCVVTADDIRGQIVGEIAALREDFANHAEERVGDSIVALTALYTDSLNILNDTLANVESAIADEKAAVAERVKALAADAMSKIKKLYYGHGHGHGYGHYGHGYHYAQTELKPEEEEEDDHEEGYGHDAIKAIIDAYEAAVESESQAFDTFVGDQRAILDDAIADKKAALQQLADAEMADYNDYAADADQSLMDSKLLKVKEIDDIIDAKLKEADKNIQELKWWFIEKFLETLYELHEHTDYYERRHLVWKALEEKHAFFDAIWTLREELGDALAVTRATMISELEGECAALTDALNTNRDQLATQSAAVIQAM